MLINLIQKYLGGTSFDANKIYLIIIQVNAWKKMHLRDHYLTRTARTTYIENMNFTVFSCINVRLASIRQTTRNKKRSFHKKKSAINV